MSNMENERQAVIIPSAGVGSSLSAIRSLGRRGIRTIAVDSIKESPGFYSKYTAKAILCANPFDSLNAYKEFLKKTYIDENCLTILPMNEVTIYILSKYRKEFLTGLDNHPWPDFQQLEMVQDRKKLFDLAIELGVPTPKYIVPEEDIGSNIGIGSPWVLKPRYSLTVKGDKPVVGSVRYALNITDLNRLAEEMRARGQSPMIQEYIPGEGYGFFALYNKGEIKSSFQHHRLREATYLGGGASYRESVKIPELEKEGLKIPERLRWHGPIMVEFRKDKRDGKFKLMEINPRFWGSLDLAIRSNLDFPYLFYQMAKEGDCNRAFHYEVGKRCKNLEWEFSHLLSILNKSSLSPAIPKPSLLKTTASILYSSFSVPDDYLAIDDLRPFVYELLYVAKRILRRL